MKKSKSKLNNKGFTLVELLVVICIFIVVFVFSYRGFRNNRNLEEFRLATDRVASEIRKLQTMALAGISDQDLGNVTYGICFDSNSNNQYLIFIDDGSLEYESDTDEVIQTIYLPGKPGIDDIIISGMVPTLLEPKLSIVFSPPKPTIYFNASTGSSVATITLTRTNILNKIGVIEVNRLTGRVTSQLVDN